MNNLNETNTDSKSESLLNSNFRHYDKKLSSHLFISLSRKISNVSRTIDKKKRSNKKENKEDYIDQLHSLIRTQNKKIKILEKGNNKNLDQIRCKLENKLIFLKTKFIQMEGLISLNFL